MHFEQCTPAQSVEKSSVCWAFLNLCGQINWVMRDVGTRKTGSRRSGNRRHGKPRTGLAFTLENRCGCLPCGGRLKKPVRTWPAPDFWDTRSKRKHGIFHGEL